jgi:imidazole glycerol-phosphate synthase subunit HisH
VTSDPIIIGCCGANLASLTFAFARLGIDAPVSEDPDRVRRASHVVLPGVGAARDAMTRLAKAGFAELVPTLTQPVLGICLGMQVLFAASEEEETPCLGVVPARVRRLPDRADLPIPQMGWNDLQSTAESPLLAGIPAGGYAYFVHSYAAPVGLYTRATADYGGAFSAVIEQDNFFGTQFHPERSAAVGARILSNFVKL